MKSKIYLLFFVIVFQANFNLQAQTVRAKIGILHNSKNKVDALKIRDRISAFDKIRIYIFPETPNNVYAVYSDKENAMLLNFNKKSNYFVKDSLILPSKEDYYEIDNKSRKVKISLIVSADKLENLEKLFASNSEIPVNQWAVLAKKLKKESILIKSDKSDKPFTIAGNVRGDAISFSKMMKVFTGAKMILKQYEIKVKK